MLLFNNNYLSSVSTKYIQVYTAVIEGMSKRQKCAKNSINITIPNGAVVQAQIKAKKNELMEIKTGYIYHIKDDFF